MKLQNIEKTKKKRKKRKNKTDTIKLIRKRANVQLNSNPKEALAIKRRKCKQNIMEINTCTSINKKKRRETNLMKCNN